MTSPNSIPRDDNAEMALLSCCVQWQDLIDKIATHPAPADLFFVPRHRLVFEHLVELRGTHPRGFDVTILTSTLASSGKLEKAGGGGILGELLTFAEGPMMFDHYLDLCDEQRKMRMLLEISTFAQKAIYESDTSSGVITGEMLQKLNSVNSGAKEGTLGKISDGLIELLEEIQKRWTGEAGPVGLATGYPTIDYRTGGLKAGQHVVIGARPGAGKTSLGLNITQNVALKGDKPLVFSAEMLRKELQIRALSEQSGIDSRLLANNVQPEELSRSFYSKLSDAVAKVQKMPITIEDKSNLRVSEIEATSRRLHREEGIDLIVVDYLQLLKPEGDAWNKEDAVSRISGGLKNLAKELEIPVVTMVQLNRSAEAANRKPSLHDFRDSGSIEQDADIALLLSRNDPEDQDSIVDVTCNIAKCRGGMCGDIDMTFNRPTTTFKEAQ